MAVNVNVSALGGEIKFPIPIFFVSREFAASDTFTFTATFTGFRHTRHTGKRCKMNIAIIGAGFAGLSAAWHLAARGCSITLFDKTGIGGGASGMAAGLLHSFLGTRAKKSEFADEGMREALSLLKIAEEFGPVAAYNGILRPPASPEQLEDFQKTTLEYPETEWWEEARVLREAPFLNPTPALFIRSGITVDCPTYLNNLFCALQKKGVKLVIQTIDSTDEFSAFDRVLFTVGAGVKKFLNDRPLSIVKGQILEIAEPRTLPFAIAGSAYCTGTSLGATFERHFEDLEPDMKKAEAYIRPRMASTSKELSELKASTARADARVYTPEKLPHLYTLNKRQILATGLGARGLLYHGLLGRWISEVLLAGHHNFPRAEGLKFLQVS